MVITPDSTITLYKDVDITDDLQIAFSDVTEQNAYFTSHIHPHLGPITNCTTIKDKIGVLRINAPGNYIKECNYMSFINPSYDNQRIYCYILDYRYVNNECTQITYTIDYWQTWMFEIEFNPSFIEREHLSVADWNKAEVNPYDPSIQEFTTSEDLPIGTGLEKPNYKLQIDRNSSTGYDGSQRDMSSQDVLVDGYGLLSTIVPIPKLKAKLGGGWAYWTVMVVMSPINWDDLPDEKHQQFLNIINHTDSGGHNTVFYMPADNQLVYDGSMQGQYAWSVQPRAVDCIFFASNEAYQESGGTETLSGFQRLVLLLTGINSISSIIGVYAVPYGFINYAGFGGHGIVPTWTSIGTEDNIVIKTSNAILNDSGNIIQSNVRNKKLLTYPYSYLRISTPDGTEKEFWYERFANVATLGEPKVCFKLVAMVDGGVPKMLLVPYEYDQIYDTAVSEGNFEQEMGEWYDQYQKLIRFDYAHAIVFDGFPQIAFVTDGYLSFVSSQYMNMLANADSHTVANAEGYREGEPGAAMTAGVGFLQTAASGLASLASMAGLGANNIPAAEAGFKNASGATNVANAYRNLQNARAQSTPSQLSAAASGASSGIGFASAGISASETVQNATRYTEDIESAETFLKWGPSAYATLSGDANVKLYEKAKPAFAASIYHSGSQGSGIYVRGSSMFDIFVTHVQLKQSILDKYDTYFDMYGYTSRRCGIPHVIDFVNGSNDNTKLPKWVTVNGKPTTYIQTQDARVNHAMKPVALAIQSLFNHGVRFMNGDRQNG